MSSPPRRRCERPKRRSRRLPRHSSGKSRCWRRTRQHRKPSIRRRRPCRLHRDRSISAKALLGTSRDALSYTELKADADGIVTERNAETGQVVQAAQTMFSVARDGPRDAIFDVYESLLFEEPAEPKIQLALVSDPSVKTEGRISEISPTINTATGTVRVKIAMDTTPDRMTLGAPVTGFASSKSKKLIVLPWTSLSAEDGKPAVWVVNDKDSTVNRKPVTIASYETGRVLVSDGIAKGRPW
ncbi:efflux RND transporter periplasmic adaptor subunit [Rhizobium sp. RCAM05350]|nr:efflux RND transporter periplasmic adaptor subunit [Rhizobium sp. RCAM05350]